MELLLAESSDPALWRSVLLSCLVAYILGQALAWGYLWTHRGFNYSRSYVVSLVAAALVSNVLMLAIGNNLARGLGIVGTLALIRFRTSLQDPLDMLYIFASFAAGVAAGSGAYGTGVIGTMAFLVVVSTLQWSSFGSQNRHDGVLRVQLPAGAESESDLVGALRRYCKRFVAITVREVAQGRELERVYQVTLRQADRAGDLVSEVAALPGASGVSVAMQEATHEI